MELTSVTGRVDPGSIKSSKNSNAPSGIEPTTCRPVVQCLNELRAPRTSCLATVIVYSVNH
jgi:hypothetical protein